MDRAPRVAQQGGEVLKGRPSAVSQVLLILMSAFIEGAFEVATIYLAVNAPFNLTYAPPEDAELPGSCQ